jgi:hypothetical protein
MEGMQRRDALALLGAYHAVHVVIDRSQVGHDGNAERTGDRPVDAGGECGHRAKRRRRREGGISATQRRCRIFELASVLQRSTKEFVGFVPGASVLQNFRTCICVAAKLDTRMQVPQAGTCREMVLPTYVARD